MSGRDHQSPLGWRCSEPSEAKCASAPASPLIGAAMRLDSPGFPQRNGEPGPLIELDGCTQVPARL